MTFFVQPQISMKWDTVYNENKNRIQGFANLINHQ